MKKLALLVITIFMVAGLSAQEKEVAQFNEKTHDFGVVKEEDGRISCDFTFKNTENMPISIKNVRTSCGCTSPNWSKSPIAPNGEGSIKVTYSASGRPGSFHKSITVTLTNGTEDFTVYLFIKGQVTPRVQQPAQQPTQKPTQQPTLKQPEKQQGQTQTIIVK